MNYNPRRHRYELPGVPLWMQAVIVIVVIVGFCLLVAAAGDAIGGGL